MVAQGKVPATQLRLGIDMCGRNIKFIIGLPWTWHYRLFRREHDNLFMNRSGGLRVFTLYQPWLCWKKHIKQNRIFFTVWDVNKAFLRWPLVLTSLKKSKQSVRATHSGTRKIHEWNTSSTTNPSPWDHEVQGSGRTVLRFFNLQSSYGISWFPTSTDAIGKAVWSMNLQTSLHLKLFHISLKAAVFSFPCQDKEDHHSQKLEDYCVIAGLSCNQPSRTIINHHTWMYSNKELRQIQFILQ